MISCMDQLHKQQNVEAWLTQLFIKKIEILLIKKSCFSFDNCIW